jgi:cytochrome P450
MPLCPAKHLPSGCTLPACEPEIFIDEDRQACIMLPAWGTPAMSSETCVQAVAAAPTARAIVEEVMRTKPAVGFSYHRATRDVVVNGLEVPKDTIVWMNFKHNILASYRTSAGFDPSQWLVYPPRHDVAAVDAPVHVPVDEASTDTAGTGGCCPFAPLAARENKSPKNLTWGHGARNCLGKYLALSELALATSIIGRKVEAIEIAEEEAAIPFEPLKAHPTGMRVTLVPRAP